MADPYIDQFETLIYGDYACEQMQKVCLGRIPDLDGMVTYAAATQAEANAQMKVVLDKQPKPPSAVTAAAVLADARDTIVRFGAYLSSLKGYPVDPRVFFRGETPSDVARKRLVKLAGAVAHIAQEIPKHPAITDPVWLQDFTSLAQSIASLKDAQQSAKVDKLVLGPEVAAERERWLAVYNANKNLIRGLLGHAGKPDLLPLIFDDLAEVHHAAGVTDDLPAPPAIPTAGPPT
jgi:hypothetical protein